MARLAGVDLPPTKRAEIGLTYIYGIGRTRAKSLLFRAGISFDKKVRDLSEDEINKVRTILEAVSYTHLASLAADPHRQDVPYSSPVIPVSVCVWG